ncbi:hypothetical protein LI073_11560 [bacterium 210917-SL.2.15]|nr:hypothetical protein [bacterium 210917-SL.2.15]
MCGIKFGGLLLVFISLAVMIFSLLRKEEPFFNLRDIIKAHKQLIRGSEILFCILPMCFAVGLSLLYTAGAQFYTEISVILGIFLSMLLASLSILGNYDFSTVKDASQREKGKKVVRQTINAIMFDSLLCVFLLLYGLTIIVLSSGDFSWIPISMNIIKAIVSAIAYYLFSVILLNLLLIVKQMSKIIEFNIVVKRDL